jgi:hypothetical protein
MAAAAVWAIDHAANGRPRPAAPASGVRVACLSNFQHRCNCKELYWALGAEPNTSTNMLEFSLQVWFDIAKK